MQHNRGFFNKIFTTNDPELEISLQNYLENIVGTNVFNELKSGRTVVFNLTVKLGNKQFPMELRYTPKLLKPSYDAAYAAMRHMTIDFVDQDHYSGYTVVGSDFDYGANHSHDITERVNRYYVLDAKIEILEEE